MNRVVKPSGREIRVARRSRAGRNKRDVYGGRLPKRCATTGKTRYSTEDACYGPALRLSQLVGVPVRIYPCTACGSWHLSRLRPGGKA